MIDREVPARLERGELCLLVSLLALGIRGQGDRGYRQRLEAMRDKLLLMLTAEAPPGEGPLPDLGEYARRKYAAELDEDFIALLEDLILTRRQEGGVAAPLREAARREAGRLRF